MNSQNLNEVQNIQNDQDQFRLKIGIISLEVCFVLIAYLCITFLESETKHFGHDAGFLSKMFLGLATLMFVPALISFFSIVRRLFGWSWIGVFIRVILPLYILFFCIFLTVTGGW